MVYANLNMQQRPPQPDDIGALAQKIAAQGSFVLVPHIPRPQPEGLISYQNLNDINPRKEASFSATFAWCKDNFFGPVFVDIYVDEGTYLQLEDELRRMGMNLQPTDRTCSHPWQFDRFSGSVPVKRQQDFKSYDLSELLVNY